MRIKIPIRIIELENDNFHLLVSTQFINNTTGNWIIDTGASKTVFDKNLSELYSVSEFETEEMHSASFQETVPETKIAYLKPIFLGKLEINTLKVALLDLSHINDLYKKTVNLKICGLIGSDFLVNHNAVINYKKKQLTIESA